MVVLIVTTKDVSVFVGSNDVKEQELEIFYQDAKFYVYNYGFEYEIEHVKQLDFDKVTYDFFLREFAYVVLNTGMKNQVAESMFKKLLDSRWNPDTINHELKRKAIIAAINNHITWFNHLKSIKNERTKIEFLETLPFIGKITKYHLARNIGLDCAKPDRHLVLLSKKFEFDTPRGMCEWLAKKTNDKIGVVDVILWRYCNMHPDKVQEFKNSILT